MNAIRKRKPRAEPVADYGPRQRLDNGTAVVSYRADPDNPQGVKVRGAHSQSYHDRLWYQGAITWAEWRAGDEYQKLHERGEGAGDGGGGVVVDCAGRRFEPPERVIQARTEMRYADARLGVDRNEVRDFLLWDAPGTLTLPVLKQALTRLALHFKIALDEQPRD